MTTNQITLTPENTSNLYIFNNKKILYDTQKTTKNLNLEEIMHFYLFAVGLKVFSLPHLNLNITKNLRIEIWDENYICGILAG